MEREIFTWSGWDRQDTMSFTFYDCVFIKDFGPWKTNETIPCILIDYEKGTIEELGDGGFVIKKCNVLLTTGV